ncbi:Lon protease family protein [Pantoea sp. 1.19]|uniref:AAA family ATPase n=1 Tax=Pantoea sp. 1.19 TaxID=1925589 RepID=UPI000948D4CC|nr:Lon protease family protein [Pantoea sp. 1.19]
MRDKRLEWQSLLPDTDVLDACFQPPWNGADIDNVAAVQPRLLQSLNQLQRTAAPFPLLLIKCAEHRDAHALLKPILAATAPASSVPCGGTYEWDGAAFRFTAAARGSAGEFIAPRGTIQYADWIEEAQLFGYARPTPQGYHLQPGLLHRANGGTLILSIRALMAQPRLWLRLREAVAQQQFVWLSPDERRPLPVEIAPMPLHIRLILTGDRDALADFQESEPELAAVAIYTEFEDDLLLADEDTASAWCQWIHTLAHWQQLPPIAPDFWPVLLREGVRYTGDQAILPLAPAWILRQLRDTLQAGEALNGEALRLALATREWQESYLSERIRDDILLEQIRIETEGDAIGQVNGLSVVDFPGHPRPFGEPSRLSCVVHVGDGEFHDVERKAELGGNIHAKGMMIMQAYLMAELELEQQLPFSASLVFEQSYAEIDGDSASLAELCALISALAQQPLRQSIAVTGSVDQFGRVQSVGGLNEKIEGFFRICQQRELTGQQGVILPASNVRQLCLADDVVDAVREGHFHLWAVEQVDDAIALLTDQPWRADEGQPSLLATIQERITQISQQDPRPRPWPLRWLNWFNQN